MELEVKGVKREFVMESTHEVLADPDPGMSIDNVLVFYSTVYPALINAVPQGPVYGKNKIVYTFKTIIGTKG